SRRRAAAGDSGGCARAPVQIRRVAARRHAERRRLAGAPRPRHRPRPCVFRGHGAVGPRLLVGGGGVSILQTVAAVGALPPSVVGAAPATVMPADIEKATGLKGIHLVSATAPGSVPGRDNYADASGKIVLWFQSIPGPLFVRAKSQPAEDHER